MSVSVRIAVLWMAAGLLCGCGQNDRQSECLRPEPEFSLPADEAPHLGMMEWWYYTGHLWTEGGRRYGFEVSFFQVASPDWATYMAHFAVSDPENLEHHFDQRLGTRPTIFPRFDLMLGDWTLSGDGSVDRLHASMDAFTLDLALSSQKPPAIHNQRGTIAMGGGMQSNYYSKTRMEAEGTLAVEGVPQPVSGMAWSDHQWGDFEVFASDGWDWFSIQLDDQTEIMIFFLHFKEEGTRLTGATFVDENGCQQALDEVSLESLSRWESPTTSAVYPLGWHLVIPGLQADLSVTPVFEDQEMDTRQTTLNVYWEGETQVSGTRAGRPVEGLGYAELTGYGMWGPGDQ